MYERLRQRLIQSTELHLTESEASAILARAFAHDSYDPGTQSLRGPLPGYQPISPPTAILQDDSDKQALEFMRMALNLTLPGHADVCKGRAAPTLVATMWGFSNFDALTAYADSDRIDPHSPAPESQARFLKRYGYYPANQSVLGRGFHQHNLILHNDQNQVSRYIDQELGLNPCQGTRVALVRTVKTGDAWLNLHLGNHKVYRGDLSESHSSKLLGAATRSTEVFVSILPDVEYQLSHLVAAHINALTVHSPDGRALIVDGVKISDDEGDFDSALKMATDYGINLVLTRDHPESKLWTRFGVHMIFGYPADIQQSNPEMDRVLVAAAPYIGLHAGRMQFVYHSEETGIKYTAMELIPDSGRASNVLSALFSKARG